jgi:uncharacterized protein (DUF1684 family)
MKKIVLLSYILLGSIATQAQTYTDSIAQRRQKYKMEFLEDKNSPLKAADTSHLKFFPADETYRVIASFTPTPNAKPFDIPTHSGKVKPYKQYGLLSFKIHDTTLTLEGYQSLTLIKNPKFKDRLFIPFNDLTNYETTYAGGRYLDLSTNDIKNGLIEVDFNRAYNPYCAYADGYSCPIPPVANRLSVAIPAGEMMYGKKIEE